MELLHNSDYIYFLLEFYPHIYFPPRKWPFFLFFFFLSFFHAALPRHSKLSPCMFRPQTRKRIWGKCRKCQWALIFLSLCLGCSDRKPVVPVGGRDNVLKSLNPAAHTHWQGTPVTRRRPNAEGNPLTCASRRYTHAGLPALSAAPASFTHSYFAAHAAAFESHGLVVEPSPCPLTCGVYVTPPIFFTPCPRAVNLYLVCAWVVTSSWPCHNLNNVYMRAPGLTLTFICVAHIAS